MCVLSLVPVDDGGSKGGDDPSSGLKDVSDSSCKSDAPHSARPADGRVVYRPARQFMPQFDGLRAASVSLRRDRIVFKYSFG